MINDNSSEILKGYEKMLVKKKNRTDNAKLYRDIFSELGGTQLLSISSIKVYKSNL